MTISIIRWIFLLALIFSSFPLRAQQAECPLAEKGVVFTYEARAATGYVNCVALEGGKDLDKIVVSALQDKAVPFSIKISTAAVNGTSQLVSTTPSNAEGVASTVVAPAGRELIISAPPTVSNGRHRNFTVAYFVVDNVGYVTIETEEISPGRERPAINPSQPPAPCTGRRCLVPRQPEFRPLSVLTNCNASNTLSPQQNGSGASEFNANKALSEYKARADAIDALPLSNSEKWLAKSFVLAVNFAPDMRHDLKNNPAYMVHESYGNQFYGAAAAVMGFSSTVAIRAGAAVQQAQNYRNPELKNFGFAEMIRGFIDAVAGVNNDNPGDAANIAQGYRYGTEVFLNDPNRNDRADSCSTRPTPTPAPVSGSGDGFSAAPTRSWMDSPIRVRICYDGNCGSIVKKPVPYAICNPPHCYWGEL